jgi:hypothetical protein
MHTCEELIHEFSPFKDYMAESNKKNALHMMHSIMECILDDNESKKICIIKRANKFANETVQYLLTFFNFCTHWLLSHY